MDANAVVSSEDLKAVHRTGTGKIRFNTCNIAYRDANEEGLTAGYRGCDILISVQLQCTAACSDANVAIIFSDSSGYMLVDANTALRGIFVRPQVGERIRANFILKNVLLKPASYTLALWVGRAGIEEFDSIEEAASLKFVEPPVKARHTEVFPGPYQCEFDVKVSCSEPDTDPAVVTSYL